MLRAKYGVKKESQKAKIAPNRHHAINDCIFSIYYVINILGTRME